MASSSTPRKQSSCTTMVNKFVVVVAAVVVVVVLFVCFCLWWSLLCLHVVFTPYRDFFNFYFILFFPFFLFLFFFFLLFSFSFFLFFSCLGRLSPCFLLLLLVINTVSFMGSCNVFGQTRERERGSGESLSLSLSTHILPHATENYHSSFLSLCKQHSTVNTIDVLSNSSALPKALIIVTI